MSRVILSIVSLLIIVWDFFIDILPHVTSNRLFLSVPVHKSRKWTQ